MSDISPYPVFLEFFESPDINLLIGVAHVAHNTAILQSVHLLPTNHVLAAWRWMGGNSKDKNISVHVIRYMYNRKVNYLHSENNIGTK